MGRPRCYDRAAVLTQAMEVFWRQGYEATSVQDLVEATGLHRGSLYGEFQDKRQLFLAAVDHYVATVTTAAIEALEAPAAARDAIATHFQQVAEQTADAQQRGCLLTNAVVELASQDAEVALRLRQGLQRVEDAFFQALVRAKDRGEIAPDADLRCLARYFTMAMQGLRVIGKLHADPEALQGMVATVLSVLDA